MGLLLLERNIEGKARGEQRGDGDGEKAGFIAPLNIGIETLAAAAPCDIGVEDIVWLLLMALSTPGGSSIPATLLAVSDRGVEDMVWLSTLCCTVASVPPYMRH
jgi:hypothetical protein